MTEQEYEQLRRHPGRFAVLPGHQQAGDELVENRAGFIVVARPESAPGAGAETRGGAPRAPDPAVAEEQSNARSGRASGRTTAPVLP